jgi:hypothetical protein
MSWRPAVPANRPAQLGENPRRIGDVHQNAFGAWAVNAAVGHREGVGVPERQLDLRKVHPAPCLREHRRIKVDDDRPSPQAGLLTNPAQITSRSATKGKTYAKDTIVIADQASVRSDFGLLRPAGEIVGDLGILTSRRLDVAFDRTRQINRLRAQLLEIFASLAPHPRDSGRGSGNLRRPRRYCRGLLRSMYLSAMVSLRCCSASRAFYDRKGSEGEAHKHAMLALARRRINILFAMLCDGT